MKEYFLNLMFRNGFQVRLLNLINIFLLNYNTYAYMKDCFKFNASEFC